MNKESAYLTFMILTKLILYLANSTEAPFSRKVPFVPLGTRQTKSNFTAIQKGYHIHIITRIIVA